MGHAAVSCNPNHRELNLTEPNLNTMFAEHKIVKFFKQGWMGNKYKEQTKSLEYFYKDLPEFAYENR